MCKVLHRLIHLPMPTPSVRTHPFPQSYLRERGIQCGLEVETSTLEEVRQVISILDHQPDTLVTRIMLDNMTRRQEGE